MKKNCLNECLMQFKPTFDRRRYVDDIFAIFELPESAQLL